MRHVVLDIIHPEYYFAIPEDEKPETHRKEQNERILRGAKGLVDTAVKRHAPIYSFRDTGEVDASFLTNRFTRVLMDMNVCSSGLAAITADGPMYDGCRQIYMYRCGTPLLNDIYDRQELRQFLKANNPFLTESLFDEIYTGMESATHIIAGGLFGNCVTNWGEYVRKRHAAAGIVYVEEACVDWSEEGWQRGLQRAKEQDARVLSLDQALDEINASAEQQAI